MTSSTNPVIQQFLSGSPDGPISMDEMAEAEPVPDYEYAQLVADPSTAQYPQTQ